MDGKCLDLYVEKMLQARMNKLACKNKDITELCAVLKRVRKVVKDSGKPKYIEVHLMKLCFTDLPVISEEHGVTFRATATDMTVFQDESCDVKDIDPPEVVIVHNLPYSICTWLSRTCEPQFDWKVCGFEHHSVSVQYVQPVMRTSVVQRSNPSSVALNRYLSVCKCARQSIDKARAAETALWDHFAMGVGVFRLTRIDSCGDEALQLCQALPQLDVTLLSELTACVRTVMQDILDMDSAWQKYLSTPSRPVVSKIDMEYLCDIRKKSKIFSSLFWNLK